jgi:hypothetical protein
MSELERRLRELPLDWPPQPDLTLAVRAGIALTPRRRLGRRPLTVAFAALVIAVAAAFAVPSARTAILRWLGLRHVRVVHVAELPPTRPLSGAVLGTRRSLVEATRRAGFELRFPRGDRPDSVYVAQTSSGVRVTLVYGKVTKPRLMLSEFRGFGTTKFVEKLVGGGTEVDRVEVAGSPGLWLSGAPHAVYFAAPGDPDTIYLDEPFLAGNTLVWERPGNLTFRLEGTLSEADALAVAESLR